MCGARYTLNHMGDWPPGSCGSEWHPCSEAEFNVAYSNEFHANGVKKECKRTWKNPGESSHGLQISLQSHEHTPQYCASSPLGVCAGATHWSGIFGGTVGGMSGIRHGWGQYRPWTDRAYLRNANGHLAEGNGRYNRDTQFSWVPWFFFPKHNVGVYCCRTPRTASMADLEKDLNTMVEGYGSNFIQVGGNETTTADFDTLQNDAPDLSSEAVIHPHITHIAAGQVTQSSVWHHCTLSLLHMYSCLN